MLLLVVLIAGISFANFSIMAEKSARNERDWVMAIEAAEFALTDAETDIENSAFPGSRSAIFSPNSALGFTENCGRGADNLYQGLCINSTNAQQPVWASADIADTGPNSPSVQLGRYTGQTMPHGAGPFPCQLPRYIIELMLDTTIGQTTEANYLYRITAIGFGADPNSRAVVQSVYRKSGHASTG